METFLLRYVGGSVIALVLYHRLDIRIFGKENLNLSMARMAVSQYN